VQHGFVQTGPLRVIAAVKIVLSPQMRPALQLAVSVQRPPTSRGPSGPSVRASVGAFASVPLVSSTQRPTETSQREPVGHAPG
jgi:hypothetical protein